MSDISSAPSETAAPTIATRVDGAIGWLVIDNPARRNAVTLDMWRAIPDALATLAATPGVRVVAVRGSGEATFVAGADISEFETVRRDATSARAYEACNAAAFNALRGCALPTVAMIRGFCLGGGLGIAAACDIRIADESARFGIPAARLGVGYPPTAFADVVRLVGPARAKLLFFTARRIDAQEARQLGLVDQVVAPQELDTETGHMLAAIASGAPLTLRAAKAGIDALTATLDPQALAQCQSLADACFDSADFKEGRTAFLEKRTPTFHGR